MAVGKVSDADFEAEVLRPFMENLSMEVQRALQFAQRGAQSPLGQQPERAVHCRGAKADQV